MGNWGRRFNAEGVDRRSGLDRKSAGEWRAYHYLKGRSVEVPELEAQGLVKLAENDLREAECFHKAMGVWSSDDWRPEAYDADLFSFVVMLYVANVLGDNMQFQACLASVKGVNEDVLNRLVAFAAPLSGCDFDIFDPEVPAAEAVEKLWSSYNESIPRGELPQVLDVVKEIVRSTYFLSPPKRYADGPGCATALASIRCLSSQKPQLVTTLEEIEREVTGFYKTEAVPFEGEDWEMYFRRSLVVYLGYGPGLYDDEEPIKDLLNELEPPSWGSLTCGQVKELVAASGKSALLRALVFQKPPNSVFVSHLMAVYDCTTHARLWLLNCHLSPFAAFQLTYDSLGKRKDKEFEALTSPLGFMERVPSFVEKLQRSEAIHAYETFYSTKIETGIEKGLIFPLRNEVLVPVYLQTGSDLWSLESRRHPLVSSIAVTLWDESKLEVFEKDSERLNLYRDTSRYVKLREYTRENYLSTPAPDSFDSLSIAFSYE